MDVAQQPVELFHQGFGVTLPSLNERARIEVLLSGLAFNAIQFGEQAQGLMGITLFTPPGNLSDSRKFPSSMIKTTCVNKTRIFLIQERITLVPIGLNHTLEPLQKISRHMGCAGGMVFEKHHRSLGWPASNEVSRPGEFHPQPLAEPDVTLSRHPAPITQPLVFQVPANE